MRFRHDFPLSFSRFDQPLISLRMFISSGIFIRSIFTISLEMMKQPWLWCYGLLPWKKDKVKVFSRDSRLLVLKCLVYFSMKLETVGVWTQFANILLFHSSSQTMFGSKRRRTLFFFRTSILDWVFYSSSLESISLLITFNISFM